METAAPRFLFLFLACFSGVVLSPVKALKQQDQLIRSTKLDTIDPPITSFPPTTTVPTDTSTQTIITVPSTTPATPPPSTPSTTPITNPPSPVTTPGTNPDPGSPVTNPAAPTGNVPTGGVPATNPGATPPAAANNGPAAPGQSWCVVKSGAPEKAVQAALDYACGIGRVDCSGIQQGASCYNPNTLQNHASFAFNNYYHKNPVQTSCDFGGNAVVTNVNPSSGSCIFPTSSTSSMGPPSSSSSSGAIPTGSGTPSILNASYPNAGGANPGSGESPPGANMSSASMWQQPFVGCIVMVISAITGRIVLDM